MKRLLIQKSVIAGSYIVLALLLEIITLVTMGLGVVPQYFGLDIAVILIIALIIFVIPHRLTKSYCETGRDGQWGLSGLKLWMQ